MEQEQDVLYCRLLQSSLNHDLVDFLWIILAPNALPRRFIHECNLHTPLPIIRILKFTVRGRIVRIEVMAEELLKKFLIFP